MFLKAQALRETKSVIAASPHLNKQSPTYRNVRKATKMASVVEASDTLVVLGLDLLANPNMNIALLQL